MNFANTYAHRICANKALRDPAPVPGAVVCYMCIYYSIAVAVATGIFNNFFQDICPVKDVFMDLAVLGSLDPNTIVIIVIIHLSVQNVKRFGKMKNSAPNWVRRKIIETQFF